jgi:hypothetical protein
MPERCTSTSDPTRVCVRSGESLSQGVTAGQVEPGDRFGSTLATFDIFYAEAVTCDVRPFHIGGSMICVG